MAYTQEEISNARALLAEVAAEEQAALQGRRDTYYQAVAVLLDSEAFQAAHQAVETLVQSTVADDRLSFHMASIQLGMNHLVADAAAFAPQMPVSASESVTQPS